MAEKFSDFIRAPGTAGPPTQEGISALGFVLSSEVPGFLGKYVRVDVAQAFTNGEKTQGRANIGAVIGTDVQAYSASLTSLAGLTTAADRLAYTTASNTWAVTTLTAFGRSLLDDADASAGRTTLGLGTMATQEANNVAITGGSITGIALNNLTFLNATLTGTPVAPTPAVGDNDTSVATTAYVRAEIPNVLNAGGSAPVYACRAWVNFNGTGTVAIRASGNVSSITDNGTGDYTVNFTTAMPDANYCFQALSAAAAAAGPIGVRQAAVAAGSLRLLFTNTVPTAVDLDNVNVAVFR